MSRNNTAKCPHCGEMIEVDLFDEVGDEVYCHECDSELEIVGKDPLRLKIVRRADDDDEEGEGYFEEDRGLDMFGNEDQ